MLFNFGTFSKNEEMASDIRKLSVEICAETLF